MVPSHTDSILIALPDEAPAIHPDTLQQAFAEVALRMEAIHLAVWADDGGAFPRPTGELRNANRIVVVPFSLRELDLWELRAFLWFQGVPPSTSIFLASGPTSNELGSWIRKGLSPAHPRTRVELIPPRDADQNTLDRLAAIAYRTGPNISCSIRGDRNRNRDTGSLEVTCMLPFTQLEYSLDDGTMVRGSIRQSSRELHSWEWISPGSLATWILGRALRSLNSRSIKFPGDGEQESLWLSLKHLTDRQHALLPGEYASRLDSVAPQSMGSAALVYDAEGKVPWDRIWTSFCDLAMAGGPPHRGTLLSSAPVEQILDRREAYDQVIAELRRGIELASGLATCESVVLGWVGVCCQDEAMAAWMLRAIIVENILVRREGAILYLPAGPDYRIPKEIKNVITAVAKTTHYWRAHLKSRQPPNPL